MFRDYDSSLNAFKRDLKLLFITESDLNILNGATINDLKLIKCFDKFGKLKVFYKKRKMQQATLWGKYFSALKIILYILQKKPKVVISRSFQLSFILGMLKSLFRIKLIHLAHSIPFKSEEFKMHLKPYKTIGNASQVSFLILKGIEIMEPHLLLKGADKIVVTNQKACLALSNYGVDRKKIAIIPFYVETAFFQNHIESKKIETPRIGYIGSFYPSYDFFCLIEAIEILSKKIKKFQVILVGDGALISGIKKEVQRKKLHSYIKFLRKIPHSQIPEALSNIDIFVVPLSRGLLKTALPIKVLEAAAAGKAIVATNVGAIDDILKNRESCLLVPPNNPEKLSDAFLELYLNPTLYNKIRIAARQSVMIFSPEKVCQMYFDLIDNSSTPLIYA